MSLSTDQPHYKNNYLDLKKNKMKNYCRENRESIAVIMWEFCFLFGEWERGLFAWTKFNFGPINSDVSSTKNYVDPIFLFECLLSS